MGSEIFHRSNVVDSRFIDKLENMLVKAIVSRGIQSSVAESISKGVKETIRKRYGCGWVYVHKKAKKRQSLLVE